MDIKLVERAQLGLEFRQHFQDQMVGVHLGEILGDLALTEGVIQRVIDHLRQHAEAGGLIAVDGQRGRGARDLLIGCHVTQQGQLGHFGQDARRPGVQLGQIGVLQRVLELRARQTATDIDVLTSLHRHLGAQCRCELRAQAGDDLLRGGGAVFEAFEGDIEAPGILRRAAGGADRGGECRDIRIGHQDIAHRKLAARRLGEGDILRHVVVADQDAVILLREEALGDDDRQIDRQPDRAEEGQQGDESVFQNDIQRAAIEADQRLEEALDDAIHQPMLGFVVIQKARAHHRRQRQRHHRRHGHGDGHGDGEFAEQTADNAAHQQHRDEHRDQRHGD